MKIYDIIWKVFVCLFVCLFVCSSVYDIIWKVLFALRPLKPHCFIYGERIEVRQKKNLFAFFSVLFCS